jgi:DMSO/TMAO reductase YedYZ heme-binding membrane subunit
MAAPDTERAGGRWALYALIALLLVAGGLAAVVLARSGSGGMARARQALEYIAGVFALLALTELVMSGVAASEPLVPTRFRIVIQSTHRATTVVAAGFIVVHVLLKITEDHARTRDAFVPFYAEHRRAVYVGLGTLASDLMILVLVTGLLRARFARSRWPWLWRSVHVLAYAVWPLAVLHGLLAGRTAKSWVNLSYAVCGGVILVAVASRLPRLLRERRLVARRIAGQDTGVPDLAAGPGAELWTPSPPHKTAGRPGDAP